MGTVKPLRTGNIVHSLKVDPTCAAFGLPWCLPRKQPTVEQETFGISGLSDVLDKINQIFKVRFQFISSYVGSSCNVYRAAGRTH